MRGELGGWAIVCIALGTSACSGAGICGADSEDVLSPDGGVYRCTLSEDCPRPANASVCVTNGLSDRTCVSCESTRCVQIIPEFCQ